MINLSITTKAAMTAAKMMGAVRALVCNPATAVALTATAVASAWVEAWGAASVATVAAASVVALASETDHAKGRDDDRPDK